MKLAGTNFDIIAPGLVEQEWSEAEALGGITWLWLHSDMHKQLPIQALQSLLLPVIKQQKFILVSDNKHPICFMSWACFSDKAESDYLKMDQLFLKPEDWNSGDRFWIIDWVTPFGHSAEMRSIVRNHLFRNQVCRCLYHRGSERGEKILLLRGRGVSKADAVLWNAQNPLSTQS